MNKDTQITITLTKVEWVHILAAVSHLCRFYEPISRLVREKYGEIGLKIRMQVEEQTNNNQLKEENK